MEKFKDLDSRLQAAGTRLKTLRGDPKSNANPALELLAQVEERFRLQQEDLSNARARIRELEQENGALTTRLNELLGLVEDGLGEVDRMVGHVLKLANDVGADGARPHAVPRGDEAPAKPEGPAEGKAADAPPKPADKPGDKAAAGDRKEPGPGREAASAAEAGRAAATDKAVAEAAHRRTEERGEAKDSQSRRILDIHSIFPRDRTGGSRA